MHQGGTLINAQGTSFTVHQSHLRPRAIGWFGVNRSLAICQKALSLLDVGGEAVAPQPGVRWHAAEEVPVEISEGPDRPAVRWCVHGVGLWDDEGLLHALISFASAD